MVYVCVHVYVFVQPRMYMCINQLVCHSVTAMYLHVCVCGIHAVVGAGGLGEQSIITDFRPYDHHKAFQKISIVVKE